MSMREFFYLRYFINEEVTGLLQTDGVDAAVVQVLLLDEDLIGNVEYDVDELLHLPVDLLIVPLVLELRELIQFVHLVIDVMVHLLDLELEL